LSISKADLGFYGAGTPLGSFSYQDEPTLSFNIANFINSQIALDDLAHSAGLLIVYAGGPTDGDGSTDAIVNFNAGSFQPAPTLSIDPTPLPAALPLFATGLALMGWLAWRRKSALL
jgi:hypothetical protein